MSFQSIVRNDVASGVIGDIAFLGPLRSKPYVLNSANAANNVIGRVFTETGTEGEAQAGGAGAFAGILINSKSYASPGTASGTLAPTLTLPNGAVGELMTMGEVFISLTENAASGTVLSYNTTTGVIVAGAPGAGEAAIPNAVVSYFNLDPAGGDSIAVAKLTN